jgi:hypothetical protein
MFHGVSGRQTLSLEKDELSEGPKEKNSEEVLGKHSYRRLGSFQTDIGKTSTKEIDELL